MKNRRSYPAVFCVPTLSKKYSFRFATTANRLLYSRFISNVFTGASCREPPAADIMIVMTNNSKGRPTYRLAKLSKYLPEVLAFLGGSLGLSVAATLLINAFIHQDWNASPFLILLVVVNILVIIFVIKPLKQLYSVVIWACAGSFQAYFVFLGRFSIGVILLPQVLLLFLAVILGLIRMNTIRAKTQPMQDDAHFVQPIEHTAPDEMAMLSTLTNRERQVLFYLSQGKSNQEIARILVISQNTVRRHVHVILKKLNCSSRGKASVLARKAGLTLDF
jgi:DNA-binding CsgD family transcriptional regulator